MATDVSSIPQSTLDPTEADIPAVPQVSIGMPVYNGEPFIREALDSLLAQTFTDFELIISDNASTDGTEAICREYAAKDERIRYVRQHENRGISANFKSVLDEAIGEYFMWAAADDLQSESFLSLLAEVLNRNPQMVCAMSDVLNVNESNKEETFISCLDDIRVSMVDHNWLKCRKRFFRNPTSNIFFCVYGLFRTSFLRQVDLKWRGIHKYLFSSEIPIMAQVSLMGPIASIPSPLKIYVRSSSSAYHKEQKLLTRRQKLLGFLSVSKVLLDIVLSSNLMPFEKIDLIWVVAITTGKSLFKQAFFALYKRLLLFPASRLNEKMFDSI